MSFDGKRPLDLPDRDGREVGRRLDVRWGVQFSVLLGRMLRVIGGMETVGMRHVCVVSGLFMVASRVVPGGLSVMMCSLAVVMGRLGVMMRCFL